MGEAVKETTGEKLGSPTDAFRKSEGPGDSQSAHPTATCSDNCLCVTVLKCLLDPPFSRRTRTLAHTFCISGAIVVLMCAQVTFASAGESAMAFWVQL